MTDSHEIDHVAMPQTGQQARLLWQEGKWQQRKRPFFCGKARQYCGPASGSSGQPKQGPKQARLVPSKPCLVQLLEHVWRQLQGLLRLVHAANGGGPAPREQNLYRHCRLLPLA